ncbi:hypothetical protein [Candidatus Endolissoclinum faulkneri]|uniref:hypothetical protein n=1 Tax=Candidatus Endolissoclinum faulkneri TaxID=1263979 RepID=UPI00040548AC|nr:hypothetical protein [Candidatus Endolissoclinum faulkneri]
MCLLAMLLLDPQIIFSIIRLGDRLKKLDVVTLDLIGLMKSIVDGQSVVCLKAL